MKLVSIVEMVAAFHSVISTVKLHDLFYWNYLGEFAKKIFNEYPSSG